MVLKSASIAAVVLLMVVIMLMATLLAEQVFNYNPPKKFTTEGKVEIYGKPYWVLYQWETDDGAYTGKKIKVTALIDNLPYDALQSSSIEIRFQGAADYSQRFIEPSNYYVNYTNVAYLEILNRNSTTYVSKPIEVTYNLPGKWGMWFCVPSTNSTECPFVPDIVDIQSSDSLLQILSSKVNLFISLSALAISAGLLGKEIFSLHKEIKINNVSINEKITQNIENYEVKHTKKGGSSAAI